MAKKVKAIIKLQLPAGKATPAPPIGPALGQHGVNIMAFCKDYNDRTSAQEGSIIPVEITIYEDRTFTFALKTPPTADLLRKALAVERGSGAPKTKPLGKIPREKIREIARVKLKDLNTTDLDSATKIVEGTARTMGIESE
jgi:large subunit ribosomal protein L11